MPRYAAFGLTVTSERPLPALRLKESTSAEVDLTIDLSAADRWLQRSASESERHRSAPNETGDAFSVSQQPGGPFRFAYSDGVEFLISPDGRKVRGRWPDGMSIEDATEYLLGPVFAFVLRLRGVVCLHAAAIAAGDGCFAVMAPAGHGKSTAAAACARHGWPILTEDLLALRLTDGEFLALPSYPRVRLWPDSAAGVFGNAEELPRITPDNPDWDKRYLDLSHDDYSFQSTPLPLRAIYTHERSENPTPDFHGLSAAESLVSLLSNVYTRWQPEPEQRAEEFDVLQHLAQTVPQRRYRGPYGLGHVATNAAALHADCLAQARIGAPADTAP